jgi:hypothetical protein
MRPKGIRRNEKKKNEKKRRLYLIPVKSGSACPLLVLSIASALVVLGTVGFVGCKGLAAAAISSIGEIVTKKYMSRLNTNNVE